jgi:ribose 1,5-bisphosphokinase PhnN
MTRLLVVTGPVGVGKTTVAWEIAEVLEQGDVAYGFFDPDAIHFHPRAPEDPFGYRVALAALDTAWPLMGADRLLMPLVVGDRTQLEHFAGWDVTVARLTASPSVLEARIRGRELGAGLQWHLARAAELQAWWREHPVEDFVVETDGRRVRELAVEVLTRAAWLDSPTDEA